MSSHFKDKSALEHVIAARKKGAIVSSEIHGEELSLFLKAFLESIQEIAFLFPLLIFALPIDLTPYLPIFVVGWLLWKTGKEAMNGWTRLGRLHRLVEEERWEIEHHRAQEKEELTALYAARGLKNRLLEETVEVLMADDNRLLQVMLEEELGLSLESQEHPLKQALGAFLGSLLAAGVLLFSFSQLPLKFSLLISSLFVILTSCVKAKKEKHSYITTIVWSLGIFLLGLLSAYFLREQYVSPLPL